MLITMLFNAKWKCKVNCHKEIHKYNLISKSNHENGQKKWKIKW